MSTVVPPDDPLNISPAEITISNRLREGIEHGLFDTGHRLQGLVLTRESLDTVRGQCRLHTFLYPWVTFNDLPRDAVTNRNRTM